MNLEKYEEDKLVRVKASYKGMLNSVLRRAFTIEIIEKKIIDFLGNRLKLCMHFCSRLYDFCYVELPSRGRSRLIISMGLILMC